MNTQKLLIGLGVVIILVLGMTFPRGNTVIERITQLGGGAAGPESTDDYYCNIGVCTHFRRVAMRQATSTLCSFKTPSASSTLAHLSARFGTTASYATAYAFGNDTTAFSTTTILVAPYSAPANAQLSIVASSSIAAMVDGVLPPNTFVNLKLSTSTAGASATFAPVGVCEAMFRTLQ